MDWWKPDPDTRRALRRWSEANPVKREKPPRWMAEEDYDREFGEDRLTSEHGMLDSP